MINPIPDSIISFIQSICKLVSDQKTTQNSFLLAREANMDAIINGTPKQIDQSDPNNIYVGYAVSGTATSSNTWRIQKIKISSSNISILNANGNDDYDSIWDNRTLLNYN